ncbi:rhodanese-like domain-containing protein [Lysinibacillus sp. NPDC048646]|uniref:rhodanese-like domain-containing protein n=1 Tax=Lysinibacillus sp. NPDC048646 TaxID=3390574 RepID=UPI003D0471BA
MQRILILFITLLLLSSCATNKEKYETIDISTIEMKVAEDWQVVDVREIEEFNEGHIPNALNLPLSSILQGEYGPLEQSESYIIICRSGNRSQTASEELAEAGFQIINVKQGISSWLGEVSVTE